MYEHPEARDLTQLLGLPTVDGRSKAWGHEFPRLAEQYDTQGLPRTS